MTTVTRSENVCFMAVESRLLDLTIGCGLYLYVGNGIYVPDLYIQNVQPDGTGSM